MLAVFNNKLFILLSFWFVAGLRLLYSTFYSQESSGLKLVRLAALLLFSLLSFLAYKNNTIATLTMASIILLSGLGTLIVAAIMTLDQVTAKVIFMLVGAYFTYGGIRLITGTKARSKLGSHK